MAASSNSKAGSLDSTASEPRSERRSRSARRGSRASASGSPHGSARAVLARVHAVDLVVGQPRVAADQRAVERAPSGPRRRRAPSRRSPRAAPRRARGCTRRSRARAAASARPRPARRRSWRGGGLALERAARPHVGAHVGDVHPHPDRVTVLAACGDRVVVVARGDRVDREGGQVGEVAPRRVDRRPGRRRRRPRPRPCAETRAAARGRASAPRARRAPRRGAPARAPRAARACPSRAAPGRRPPPRAGARRRASRGRRRSNSGSATVKRPRLESTATSGGVGAHLAFAASVRSAAVECLVGLRLRVVRGLHCRHDPAPREVRRPWAGSSCRP